MSSLSSRQGQRGAALLLTLVFVTLLALLGFSAFDTSHTAARIGGNSQVRNEALAVAQRAIEQVLSSDQFAKDPAALGAAKIPVDIDADGSVDYQADLQPGPRCERVRSIPTAELDPARASDIDCFASAASGTSGLSEASPAASAGASLCASSEWRIRAAVSDARTGTATALNQGVSVRTDSFLLPAACP